MRSVLAGVDAGDDRAILALDVFVHRVVQGIASMATTMGGVDGIAFSAGVGERAPRVRNAICTSLAFLGVALDANRNATCVGEDDVSSADAKVRVLVVPAQESWMIARECVRVMSPVEGSR